MAPPAQVIQLPCDGDGTCMTCKTKPPTEELLNCCTCGSSWHVTCLLTKPESLSSVLQWLCPDCSGDATAVGSFFEETGIVAEIRKIEADPSLTEKQKAKKRQALLSGKSADEDEKESDDEKDKDNDNNDDDVTALLDNFQCSFCMQVPERPVTTPCGHNFCLKCFQRWIKQGENKCAKCRHKIPAKLASNPRINSSLVSAIRWAKLSKSIVSGVSDRVYHFIHNDNRPDEAFTTERAKKTGKANAASGKIFVTVPSDHFGPIPAENDPVRNQGVLVGECWELRLDCRQWGVHWPHVSGIAGQSKYGAQSVVLSGGYIDDEDHGEWFLYTGSGGRDLSGNKRTNKNQSFDQTFDNYNEALRVSCQKGYPVRVVRSHKEKRSAYAPENGLRYDGVYRIEKCWRKVGKQGFKVCRYLFIRCDNEPAPWTSDEHGDRPRPLPAIAELRDAIDLTERKESPSWDFDDKDGKWKWLKPPPLSQKPVQTGNSEDMKEIKKAVKIARAQSFKQRLLREFSCLICRNVMNAPVTTPCAHNFCKSCLEGAFAGKTVMRDRNKGGRALRAQKNVMNCPSCPTDISDFLQDIKINRELMNVIESLKTKAEDEEKKPAEEEIDEAEDEEKKAEEEEEKDEEAEEEEEIDEAEDEEKRADEEGRASNPEADVIQIDLQVPVVANENPEVGDGNPETDVVTGDLEVHSLKSDPDIGNGKTKAESEACNGDPVATGPKKRGRPEASGKRKAESEACNGDPGAAGPKKRGRPRKNI